MDTKFCIYCGKVLPADAVFCVGCGKKQLNVANQQQAEEPKDTSPSVAEVEAVESTATAEAAAVPVAKKPAKEPKVKKKFKPKRLIPLIRNSLIMAVSIIALIFAFLPITSIETPSNMIDLSSIGEEAEIEISPIRSIGILFASFKSLDSDELSDEYEDVMDRLEDKYSDDFNDIEDESDLEDVADELDDYCDELAYQAVRLSVMKEGFNAPVQYYFSALLSLAYIALAIALFTVSLFNLLSTFNIIRSEGGKLYKWTITLLTLIPAFLLLLHFAYTLSYASFGEANGMTGGAVTVLVLSLVLISAITTLRIIFSKKLSIPTLIKRAVSLTLCILVICLAFAPVMTATVKTEFSGSSSEKEAKFGVSASVFAHFGTDDETTKEAFEDRASYSRTEMRAYMKTCFASFSSLKRTETGTAYGTLVSTQFIHNLYASAAGENTAYVGYVMFGFIFLFAVAGAAIALWQNLLYLATGKSTRAWVLSAKLTTVIAAGLALIFVIIFLAIGSGLISKYVTDDYRLTLNAGIIFFVIFAIGSLVCPTRKKTDEEEECSIPLTFIGGCDCDGCECTESAYSCEACGEHEEVENA